MPIKLDHTTDDFSQDYDQLMTRLTVAQQRLSRLKVPVIILLEGWAAAGKGTCISRLVTGLDPRGFKAVTTGPADLKERRYPGMRRYWKNIPEYGNITIFDHGWYHEVINIYRRGKKRKKLAQKFSDIIDFETQLCADGYVILKFFMNINRQEQKKRLNELTSRKETRWRVTDEDLAENAAYSLWEDQFDDMLMRTDLPFASWYIVDASNKRAAAYNVARAVVERLEQVTGRDGAAASAYSRDISEDIPLPSVKLRDISLNHSLPVDMYKRMLSERQKRLSDLHNKLYYRKIPVIIAYEGWDAAGKGGNIKRLARALDPRGYEVIPISAPKPEALYRQYLWRFWMTLPKDGHIAIYDRTWYGRVLVERIENLTPEPAWSRAYDEINRFERQLHDWGAVIVKFWIHIDRDEQLRRFNDRQNTPEKRWKITDEDWRNREKWDAYETAVDEMIERTNTACAPWTVIESNDKRYARIKALDTVIAAIENALED